MESKDKQQEEQKELSKGYTLMFNVQKQKNFGTIIRSAAAFNFSEIFVVQGHNKKKKLPTFGSQGTANKSTFHYFEGLKEVKQYCNENKIFICGVEIMPQAQPIQLQPFKGDTLFVLGNEGAGLNQNQIAICDHFVYIPQYSNKTASLNVAVAASIIFHHFALWAGYQESPRVGQKYEESDEYSKKMGELIHEKGNSVINDPNRKRERREEAQKQKEESDGVWEINNGMFNEGEGNQQ